MTDNFSAQTDPDITDDIIDDEPTATTRLDREASAFLAQADTKPFAPTTSVRKAVREDLDHGRQWARHRTDAARDAIVEQPLVSTFYALGAGVLIGLLLRR